MHADDSHGSEAMNTRECAAWDSLLASLTMSTLSVAFGLLLAHAEGLGQAATVTVRVVCVMWAALGVLSGGNAVRLFWRLLCSR